MADAANRRSGDPEPMDALEPNAGADGPVLEVAAGVLDQRHGRIGNAACPDRGIARDQAREAGSLPAATPSANRLSIQAKPPSRSFDSMVRGIVHDGETALDGVVIAFRDLQRRQFLGRDRRHAVPPSDGLRLYRSGGAHSQQDISTFLSWSKRTLSFCDYSGLEGPLLVNLANHGSLYRSLAVHGIRTCEVAKR